MWYDDNFNMLMKSIMHLKLMIEYFYKFELLNINLIVRHKAVLSDSVIVKSKITHI